MTQTEFGFDGGPPPSLDFFGVDVALIPFVWVFGLIILPFALGILARQSLASSFAAFVAFVLTMSALRVQLLQVGGLAPNIAPFPWDIAGGISLVSAPGLIVGYLAARFYERRRGAK